MAGNRFRFAVDALNRRRAYGNTLFRRLVGKNPAPQSDRRQGGGRSSYHAVFLDSYGRNGAYYALFWAITRFPRTSRITTLLPRAVGRLRDTAAEMVYLSQNTARRFRRLVHVLEANGGFAVALPPSPFSWRALTDTLIRTSATGPVSCKGECRTLTRMRLSIPIARSWQQP